MRWLVLLALPAFASAQGRALGPDPTLQWEGPYEYSTTGASMLDCAAEVGLGQNCAPLESNSALFDVIPEVEGLQIVHARLNWFASGPLDEPKDTQVTLQAPGGEVWTIDKDDALSEEFDDPLDPLSCMLVGGMHCDFTFYSYYADVTELLQGHLEQGNSLNGMWTVGDMQHTGANPNDPRLQALALASVGLGGWSMIVVYEVPDAQLRRIYFYQGFELNSGMNRVIQARGFRAPPDPLVDVTFCALEGDTGIAGDALQINGIAMSDGCNPANNTFNGTINTGRMDGVCQTGVHGLDIDQFVTDQPLDPADEEATITIVVPRGDGLITPGEQMFTNWLVIAFDHEPASLTGVKPEKNANPPSGSTVELGQEIEYGILVENTGGDFATNVIITDPIPAGTTYVPNSTVVDAIAVADVQGRSPLETGLNLATVGIDVIEPQERHRVRFRVTVNEDLELGDQITNVATLSADDVPPAESDPVFHAVGILPDGGFLEPDAGPDMDLPDAQVPDVAPDGPDPDDGVCPPNTQLNLRGECEPIPDMAAPDASMCPEPDDQCGPGTRMVDGQCQAICGAGLRWDPSCAPCGQCRLEGDPPCGDGGEGAKGDEGCGCRATRSDPTLPLLFGLLLVGFIRRR